MNHLMNCDPFLLQRTAGIQKAVTMRSIVAKPLFIKSWDTILCGFKSAKNQFDLLFEFLFSRVDIHIRKHDETHHPGNK